MNKGLLTAASVIAIINGVIFCIFIITIPLGILNFVAAGKINAYRDGGGSRDSVRGWSIYLLFTTFYFLGGIFGLVGIGPEGAINKTESTLESRLLQLNRLYDTNIITKEEYEARRKRIIQGE